MTPITKPKRSQINKGNVLTIRTLKLNGHVGFDTLPDQLVNKNVDKGFDFNILCVGDTGMGKSTLMNALFNSNFDMKPYVHTSHNVKLKAQTYKIQESNVRLRLTICNTLGYGDQINKSDSIFNIVCYVNEQFEDYLQEELNIKRTMKESHDTRIHVCLYFICPTGHGLRSMDILSMKQLDSKVNIIPIIAKADTITASELQGFKKRIMDELIKNEVKIYQFPVDDETVASLNSEMNKILPFAVVASTDFVKIDGKSVRARRYPWGTVQIDDETHCDFVNLREMLIRTNMEDLREVTHTIHYELYRQSRMLELGFTDVDSNNKPMSLREIYELKQAEHLALLQAEEEDVREKFIQRVKKKEIEVRGIEKELLTKYEDLRMEVLLEKKKLFEKQKILDDDYLELRKRKKQFTFSSTPILSRSKRK